MKISVYIAALLIVLTLSGCGSQPNHAQKVSGQAPIYPDYSNITIPVNIAPLNFLLRNKPNKMQVLLCGQKDTLTVNGNDKVIFPIKEWKNFLSVEAGHRINVRLAAEINGKWVEYPPFFWDVAPDKIDRYVTYRLIEPGYEVWNSLQICERDLEDFDERVIADNNQLGNACMNCHIHDNRNADISMFHLRGKNGGTILNKQGKIRKLTLKNDNMISPAVYGDFHPSGDFGVFSTNIIIPEFHAKGNIRMEVYDTQSDIVVADFNNNRMLESPLISATPNSLETFPVFSADGHYIYFCTAPAVKLPEQVKKLKYSICRIAFDAKTKTFGNMIDTLWNARQTKQSACHLKASPDGKYLLFTVADYGTFPIWHREADLRLLNLQTGKTDNLKVVNSDRSDTYHSWSSNSRWFIFASKRGDGQYGKPYIAYLDKNGMAHKAFVLPQKDPSHYDETLKSYNLPDLSNNKVSFSSSDIENAYENMKAEQFK